MNKKTVYFLIGVGVVALLYFGDQAYRSYIDEPARKRTGEIEKLDENIDSAKQLISRQSAILQQLEFYEQMSLPRNREVTRTAYQDWLLSLVKSNGLLQTSIDAAEPIPVAIDRRNARANQPKKKTILVRFSYSLSCRGSLNQIVNFLFQFYQSGHLHKIQSLSLNPSGDGKRIDARMTIEALTLNRTERETELADFSVNRLAKSVTTDYSQIARRNIFSRKGDAVLHQVRLTGITYGKSGEPMVWIQTDIGQSSKWYSNEDNVLVDYHQIEILDIQSQIVFLLVDSVPVKLELGKSLGDVLEPDNLESESEEHESEPETLINAGDNNQSDGR